MAKFIKEYIPKGKPRDDAYTIQNAAYILIPAIGAIVMCALIYTCLSCCTCKKSIADVPKPPPSHDLEEVKMQMVDISRGSSDV